MASKMATVVSEAMNSTTAVYTFLGVAFVALGVRSNGLQKRVEALESEKDSLLKSNKSMKTNIWDMKQLLYAEAAAAGASAVVPLTTLQTIYGELPTSSSDGGDIANEDKKSSARITI
ncbi:PREDICTED: uncharacterized protein LOC104821809 [Tarenaya hassleriana]|uniref:uncharacterized protein LOC104821809 n=1 Tax=Tarenaya hassleriana TaxID=28532 RepID=UPI00053C357D|nr:PREDICTED: uncharacterized protein LOC104821809 [Tarenaya hassleriana]XP_010551110.1 PREDICTED: uncharacterized protein LOC104821809 [Tarenaya hassleriana]